jgi:hypothetical protein
MWCPRGRGVDRHDRLLPEEGCHALFAWISFGLLALGESPRGHEIFYYDAFLELVLDRVHMVWTGRLEESLNVVCRLSCLALETVFSDCDVLLVEAVHFLVVVVIAAGSNCDPPGASLSPLFAALGALDGGIGGRRPTAAGDCFPIT